MKKTLEQYMKKVEELDAQEAKLRVIRAKIKELSFVFSKGNMAESIKKDKVIKEGGVNNDLTQASRLSKISIADLFRHVNRSDESFVKYISNHFFEERAESDTADTASKAETSTYRVNSKKVDADKLTSEQKNAVKMGKRLGRKVVIEEFDVVDRNGNKADGVESPNGYIDSKGNIHINKDCKKPISFVLKHELTHFIERAPKIYNDLANKIMDSDVFKSWIKSKGYSSVSEANKAYIEVYKKFDSKCDENKANTEMLADFVGENMFGGKSEVTENLLNALKPQDRNNLLKLVKKWIERIKQAFSGNKKTLSVIEQFENDFIKAYRAVSESTEINFSNSIENYPYNMQTVIKEYLSSVDQNILSFIQNYSGNAEKKFKRLTISKVSEKQVNDIKELLDIDVSGYTNAINTNAIQHILNRHGANGSADTSMSNQNDIARISYILESYDSVEIVKEGFDEVYSDEFKDKNNKPAPMIKYSKKINGTYYMVQAIPESRYNKLWIVSAYINKKGADTQVLNSKSNSTVGMSLASTAPNDIIGEEEVFVNSNSMQDIENNSTIKVSKSEDGERVGNAETKISYSLSENAADDVKNALKNKNYSNVVKLTESTPSIVCSQKGVKNLPLVMKASHIRENIFTKNEAKSAGLRVDDSINYHGLGEELFLKVIGDLDNVQLAYRGTKNAEIPERRENYFLLISQYKDAVRDVINIPVYINNERKYNRVSFDANKIATVYGKRNFYEYIQKEIKRGNLIRIKNRSISASEGTTPIVASYNKNTSIEVGQSVESDTIPTNNRIPQNDTSVNSNSMQNIENDASDVDTSENTFSISVDNSNENQHNSNDYSYESLISKKHMTVTPLSIVSDAEHNKYKDKNLFAKEMMDIARDVGNQKNTDTAVYLHCDDIAKDILISKDSYKHGAARIDKTYASVCMILPEILKNAIAVNELKSRENTNGAVILLGLAETNTDWVAIRMIVNNQTWKLNSYDILYAVQKVTIEKEDVGVKPPDYLPKKGSATSSNISIHKLLEIVKDKILASDVFSVDVLEHFAMERRENNQFDDSLIYSIPLESPSDLLEQYENGDITREEYLGRISNRGNNRIENPSEIANLTEADVSTTPKISGNRMTAKGDSDSKLFDSLMGSDIFDERFKKEAANDKFLQKYQSITNEETLKEAKSELDSGGAAYVNRWFKLDAKRASLIDTAVGFLLLDRYQRVGDYKSAMLAAEKLREIGTSAGQTVQLFSILGRLTPDTMVAFANEQIDKAFDKFVEYKSQAWIDAHKDLYKLTDDDVEYIRRRTLQAAHLPDGRDKAILLAEIQARIESRLPPLKGQALKAFQQK